jgi:hypothetical protein
MRTKLETLEVTSPLDHNLEAVLPGLHTRLSSMQREMALGFSEVKTWQLGIDAYMQHTTLMVQQSQAAAAQLVQIASTMIGWGGGTGGGAGQASPAPLVNSQRQSQRQGADDENDDNDDNDDNNFGKAKRHQMIKRHQSLFTIYYEWYGLDSSKDQPIVGGFAKCEEIFKSSWRKNHTDAEKKHFSRLRKIIQGLQKKAVTEGSDMAEVVDILDPIFQKDCKKAMSKMVDWMLQQALIPQGKRRATA